MAEVFPILSNLIGRILSFFGRGSTEQEETTAEDGMEYEDFDWSGLGADLVIVKPVAKPPGKPHTRSKPRHMHSRKTYRAKRYAWRVAHKDSADPPKGGIPLMGGARLYHVEEAPQVTVPIILGVYPIGGELGGTIQVNTDVPTTAVLSGPSGNMQSSTPKIMHVFSIGGLGQGKTYTFTAVVTHASGGIANSGIITLRTLDPDTTGPTILKIFPTAKHDSVAMSFETSEPSKTSIYYGTTTAYGSTLTDNEIKMLHRFDLTGLQPNVEYHYRIRAIDISENLTMSGDNVIKTLAAPDVSKPVILTNLVDQRTEEGVRIRVTTDDDTTAILTLVGTPSQTLEENWFNKSHMFMTTGYPNTEYHYTVKVTNQYGQYTISPDRTFMTTQIGEYSNSILPAGRRYKKQSRRGI